jgi:hypothetical protein
MISINLVFLLFSISFVGVFIFDDVTVDLSSQAAPSNIIVDFNGTGNFTTIQGAIDNANAGDMARIKRI